MKRQHLSAGLVVLTLLASTACSPDSGVERQQTGSGGSGASGGGGGGAGGTGSGGAGTGGGGTSGGSSGSGGVASGAGGVAGSAGNAAGGTAGTAGSAGAGGTGGSPGVGCTGTELFCEDFEDDTDGMAPGSPWLPKDDSCQYQSSFSSAVTTELANNGTKSFKATNKSNPDCRISAPFPDADDFWLRAFIQWEADADFAEKETLALDLHGPSGIQTDDPALRFGTRTKAPCTASPGPQITIMAVASGEQTGCNGTIQEPKGKWYCFEAHVTQASVLSVKTYIDGAGFTYQSEGKAATDVIETPAGAALKEKMNHVRLGIFSTGNFSGNVYIDDIAIATTRLNCGK